VDSVGGVVGLDDELDRLSAAEGDGEAEADLAERVFDVGHEAEDEEAGRGRR
jgi:hypothetical protein